MLRESIRCVLAVGAMALALQEAGARLPPPPVPFDVLLKGADRIVVGRVQPGSVRSVASPDKKQTFHEFTLIVPRSLDGKDIGKQVTVTEESFPAKLFPPSKEHPHGRFLLTGWGFDGHVEQSEMGLDLYAEQVWFLQRFRDDRLRNPATAPHGVSYFDSVHKLEHAGLIELFARKANVAKLRKHIAKEYRGKIPRLAVQGLYGSPDPAAGALVWDYLQQYEALLKTWADLRNKELGELKKEYGEKRAAEFVDMILSEERARVGAELEVYHRYDAFRTLNSLGRDEALKWTRKSLNSSEDICWGGFETLKRFQDTDSVPRLLKLLKDTAAYDERERIIATLGEIGDARAIPALIDALPQDSWRYHVQLALFQLTDIRLSPNGDYAKRWWQRNKDKPRWHWLKQGIEQDLYLLANNHAIVWDRDLDPWPHLSRVTCWRQTARKNPELSAEWAKWWQANKDLPQERWILDSFQAVGHPLPDLASKEAVDALVKAYNTKPEHWRDTGPVIDPYLHHYWCQRMLTCLTGWDIEDTHYLHYSQPHWYDYQKFGPLWESEWRKSRYGAKVNPIEIPAKQPFTMDDEDRRLLCEDYASLSVAAVFRGPLIRKQFPGILGKSILATFEITLTNRSNRELTLHTKPTLGGESGTQEGFGSSLHAAKWQCTSHTTDFATLQPGQSIAWTEQHSCLHYPRDNVAWCYFRLHFEQRGKEGLGWRGQVATPWYSFKNENVRDE